MIKRIVHLADIHIKKSDVRHHVHRDVFQKAYDKIKEEKPDKILIVGDIYHDFVNLSPEAEILMGEFLNNLADIAPVIITRGNHDLQKQNLKKKDVVEAVTTLINNPNVTFYNKSGFYEDDNIMWVVHHHRGHDNPWEDIPHTVKKDKIYIDLYHDPIQGCLGDNGEPLLNNKYTPDELKGDYSFLGDIHLRQDFNDGKIRYCGSILQNSFGESVNGHGFLIWNITDKKTFTVEEVDIPNEYNFINLNVTENYNYENIDLDNPHITPHSEIKVKWNDYSANINMINEMNIRQYIKEKWSIDKVKFDKKHIYTDITDVDMVNESINVLDPSEQRKIFIEYLKSNKYEDDFIEDVLKIDGIINDRTKVDDNNGLTWTVEKFWFNNFKSYGDGNLVEFSEMEDHALIQIGGLNMGGKTTILDALSYILYGKTSATVKREKNGDNRYLNNKRDKDFCDAGAVININGEQYTILRETHRKWNKDKTGLSSVSTTMEYFIGDDILEENKLNDEQRKDTQKLIETAIGDFSDFIRLVLTTADNLNELLSMDRATFMDSLIRDAGFDIFEKKLVEFKGYKKELTDQRKNINIETVFAEIERITLDKSEKDVELIEIESEISDLKETRELQVTIKEEKLKQLDKIDEELKTLDVSDINQSIGVEEGKIETNDLKLNKIEELKESISTYDSYILTQKEEKFSSLNETITNERLGQSEYEKKISENSNEIKLINHDIDNIINNFTTGLASKSKDLDLDVMKIKEDFGTKITNYLSAANEKISEVVEEQSKVHTEIDRLMEDGKKLKVENTDLETSSTCITCKRPLEDVDMGNIQLKVDSNRLEMTKIKEKIGELKPIHEKIGEGIENLRDKIKSIKDKDYTFDTELLNIYNDSKDKIKIIKERIEENTTTIELVKNNNIPGDLTDLLASSYKRKSELSLYIDDLQKELDTVVKDLVKKQEDFETLKNQISTLKAEKESVDKMKEKISLESKILMDIEISKNTIKDFKRKLEEYQSTLDKIEKNKVIENDISGIDLIINGFDNDISEKNNDRTNHIATIGLFESQLEQFNDDIVTYEKHKKEDQVLSTYMKCVHRDGLPTFLLKKSIHIINQELSKILMDVDFTVYFDDELNLKLSSDSRLDVAQNAIESSGMERTFTAVALKMALRKVNNKSKPNFVLLDEIMGKLVAESVDMFIQLLDNIKQDVDKLVIIEHVHPINYDVLIEVEKDNLGVSTLEIDY